jgi:hypothetical protein
MFAFTTRTPVEVAGGATSQPAAFPELTSADDASIRLRVVVLGAPANPPGFAVATANSAPVTLTTEFQVLADGSGDTVAEVATADEGDGTHRLRIVVVQPGQQWTLRITNREGSARSYLTVVADNADETRQPWIDVPAALELTGVLGQPSSAAYPVANLGTGTLRVGTQQPPAGHTLTGAPTTVAVNATAQLTLTVLPSAVGTSTATLVVASDDAAAPDTPSHNHTTRVTSVVTGAAAAFAAPGHQIQPRTQLPDRTVTVNGTHLDTVRGVTFERLSPLPATSRTTTFALVSDAALSVRTTGLALNSRHRIQLHGDAGGIRSDDILTIGAV